MVAFLIIVFWHWFADFVLQSNYQATGKSKSWQPLISHTFHYSWSWYLPGALYAIYLGKDYPHWHLTYFVLITFVCHTVTDYFTSRLNSRLWAEVERRKKAKEMEERTELKEAYDESIGNAVRKFFNSVGFDQVLHYFQLFLTYKLLF